MSENIVLRDKKPYSINCLNAKTEFLPWIEEAGNRIFSLSSGNRITPIAEDVMRIGFGKILYAANELGSDIDVCKPFVLFAPDGTCTYNKERFHRGFSYGCLINAEFDGMIASQNAMPNGCGFSLFELKDYSNDKDLVTKAKKIRDDITEDQAEQLGKGNHFIAIYQVKDKYSGEDTGRRFVILHCSGHEISKEKLYFLDWLVEEDGYNKIETPHGSIWLIEKDAKTRYLEEYQECELNNVNGRQNVMSQFFENMTFELISDLTHQGMMDNGKTLKLGIQTDKNTLLPVAFNPEEGAISVKIKPNLNKDFLSRWEYSMVSESLGYNRIFEKLDIIPHGAGYEFKNPVSDFNFKLSSGGIDSFTIELETLDGSKTREKATYFKEIRQHMSYKRKLPVMKKVFEAELGKHIYDLVPLIQIHPKTSIPGGRY